MRRTLLPSFLLPLLVLAAPVHAQDAPQGDGEYLQQRASSLNDRIELATREHKLSKKKAARLQLSVRKVQTMTGHLQASSGTVDRTDADRMNQQLTDVERALPQH